MLRRSLVAAAALLFAGFDFVDSQADRQQHGYCEPVANAATTRVRTSAAGGAFCTTMWCLSPTDGATSGNCRCARAPSDVCDRLGYPSPEPSPELEPELEPEPEPEEDELIVGSAERNAQLSAECERYALSSCLCVSVSVSVCLSLSVSLSVSLLPSPPSLQLRRRFARTHCE